MPLPTSRGPIQQHEAEFIVSLRHSSSKYSEGEKALFKTLPFQAIQPDRNELGILNKLDVGLDAVTEEFRTTFWLLHAKEYLERGEASLKKKPRAREGKDRVRKGRERFKSKEDADAARSKISGAGESSTSMDGAQPSAGLSLEWSKTTGDASAAQPQTAVVSNAKVVLNSKSLEEMVVMTQDKRLKRAKKLDQSHPGWRPEIPPLFSPAFLLTLDEPAKLFLSLYDNATHSFLPKPVTVTSQDIEAMIQLKDLLDYRIIAGGALWRIWKAEGRGGDTLTLASTIWVTASGRSHSWQRGIDREDLKRARQDELWEAATAPGGPSINQPLPAKRSRDTPSHLGDFVVKEEDIDSVVASRRKK